jgi:hypothetical protein
MSHLLTGAAAAARDWRTAGVYVSEFEQPERD